MSWEFYLSFLWCSQLLKLSSEIDSLVSCVSYLLKSRDLEADLGSYNSIIDWL